MGFMATLQAGMPQGEWPSSLTTMVSSTTDMVYGQATDCTDMLTPLDKSLDNLEDLSPSEM
jgi:hypothetical protein